MKVCKKLAAVLAATLMSASMVVSISASAGNTSNTAWSVGNNYCRPKYDDTSVYVQNVSQSYRAIVSVYGRKTSTGGNINVAGGSVVTTTNLTLPANCERFIRQNINEYSCSYAQIYFSKANTNDNGLACGQWSPDSVGSYPTLN